MYLHRGHLRHRALHSWSEAAWEVSGRGGPQLLVVTTDELSQLCLDHDPVMSLQIPECEAFVVL